MTNSTRESLNLEKVRFADYKYTVIYFFIYILLNEYNTMKLVGNSNINHRFKLVKSSSKKRFIEEIDSDMEQ